MGSLYKMITSFFQFFWLFHMIIFLHEIFCDFLL
jgi:hypothetical protein